MASSYSPDLRIELIGTGDQSGLWGETTNTNLGTLIEQAIAGVESIPMLTDSDYTLSALNGSPDESRNAVIVMTSVIDLTATRNVIIPSVDKLYSVKNSTTGGQSIIIKTSAGTGITVPNGETVQVYCDGVDVHQAATYFPTLKTVTAAYGTNTTQVATTAFVQQAGLTAEIKLWPTAVAPTGYLMCNGSAVSRTTYASLFAIVGTTFGSGDGSTTFNLPNYTNRMPIGAGDLYNLAATGGSKDAVVVAHTHASTVTGTTDSAGSHTHSVTDPGHTHSYLTANGYEFATGGDLNHAWAGGTRTISTGSATTGIAIAAGGTHSHSLTVTGTTDSTGVSGTNANLPPYLGIYYIIKY
jgi:microcystin-dependent protein